MLATGLALALLALLSFALNWTALPVVIDPPLGVLAMAGLAAITLLTGLRRETRRPSEGRLVRLGLGAATLLGVLVLAAWSVHRRFLSYRTSEARFTNDQVDLAGTLYTPRSSGPHPGVVFVHGSGPETRREYAFFAKHFARVGFAALVYDKRGTGRSAGSLYESDYLDYAEDVLAGVRYLKQSDAVDPRCIGLIGFSEGEWVAPLAASRSGDIAFLIVIAPSGVSPAAQVNEEIALRLRKRGYPADSVARALALNTRVLEYQRTGRPPNGLAEDLREASRERWFIDAEDIPAQLYPSEEYKWWRSVMDFSPAPVWARVAIPVLLLKGGQDPNSTAALAQQEIESALQAGGNENREFVVFPDGDHSLLRWPLGRPIPPPLFANGYLEKLVGWAGEQGCARR